MEKSEDACSSSEWWCRMCLHKNKKSSQNTGKNVAKHPRMQIMISRLFSITIRETDTVSTIICRQCLKKVRQFDAFYNFVRENQSQLKQTAQKNKRNEEYDEKEDVVKKEIDDFEEFSDDCVDDVDHESDPMPTFDFSNKMDDTFKEKFTIKLENFNDNVSEENGDGEDKNFEFPTELIKNGKLMLKGSPMENILRRFYDIRCDLCEIETKFDSLFEMFNHYKMRHRIRGYLKCCDSKMESRKKIIFHMAFHIQPSAFTCIICNKIVSRPNLMKGHLKSHLPDSEKEYSCEECSKRFATVNTLKNHLLTHVSDPDRMMYDCEYCGKQFKSKQTCKIHMTTVHSEGKYLCPQCGKSFKCKVNLEYHISSKHDTDKKPQEKCAECGRLCVNKQTLRQHMKLHNAERLQCDMCGYETYAKKFLNKHIQIKHSNDKPFICNNCGKGFKYKKSLEAHMVQHTGERKYSCDFCNKTFASSGNHVTHQKRMHPDQYAFKVEKLKAKKYGIVTELDNAETSLQNQYETARKLLQSL